MELGATSILLSSDPKSNLFFRNNKLKIKNGGKFGDSLGTF